MSKALKLWFFRDLSDEQRLKLFGLFDLPVNEIGEVHGRQVIALRHITQILVEMVRDVAPTEIERLQAAAKDVIASASDTYKKRNGHLASFEDDSGEKCWIVPFDAFESLRSAVDASMSKGGA